MNCTHGGFGVKCEDIGPTNSVMNRTMTLHTAVNQQQTRQKSIKGTEMPQSNNVSVNTMHFH